MKVYSIFRSISGEAGMIYPGTWCVFIRLHGCNLSCHYCDSRYASGTLFQSMKVEEVFSTAIQLLPPNRPKMVLITGGEPLLQMEDVQHLTALFNDRGIHVSIETNGSIIPSKDLITENPHFIFDYKMPSSGAFSNMIDFVNLPLPSSTIKFVCTDFNDYSMARHKIREMISNRKTHKHFISPAMTRNGDGFLLQPDTLYQWMDRDKLHNVGINCQLHKLLKLTSEHP